MDDLPNPMLNTAVARSHLPSELPEQFKQQAFARLEEIMGLTFDRETGMCTTPGTVRMEGELKDRWAALVEQIGECRDAQKVEQLWREAGQIMREGIRQGETGTPDKSE